eukprot:CCRYP_016374-RA/>CCRYP_016374-RA protein AED:0.03 eAED:0.03 QI:0/1/0.5/1/0/0/2/798/75
MARRRIRNIQFFNPHLARPGTTLHDLSRIYNVNSYCTTTVFVKERKAVSHPNKLRHDSVYLVLMHAVNHVVTAQR